MTVVASKLIAVSIVDPENGDPQQIQVDDSLKDQRIGELAAQVENLEAKVKDLTQWQMSIAPSHLPSQYESSSPSVSSGSSDSGSPSLSPTPPRSPTKAEKKRQRQLQKKSTLPWSEKPIDFSPDEDVTSRILTIIQSYGQNEKNDQNDDWIGRKTFDPIVRQKVEENLPIDLVLPAFPWKSVNKKEKVLGDLPDLGEELALGRLQKLCEDIQSVYPPGAYATISSDGLVYNDLFGIPTEEVFEYGHDLRQMAVAKGFDRLKFLRIMNLLGMREDPNMTKEEYVSTVPEARKMLMEKYLPEGFDAREAILNDPDINLTYRGYSSFLERDFKHSFLADKAQSHRSYKKSVKNVGENMIHRGKAFAALIEYKLPDYVRLSIHRSTGSKKLSMPLIPQPNYFSMTPWHCAVAVTAKGEFRTSHAIKLKQHFDLVEKDGRPYYYRDRSDVWKWDTPVEFEFFYPQGVRVHATVPEGSSPPTMSSSDTEKLERLQKSFSRVVPIGFASS